MRHSQNSRKLLIKEKLGIPWNSINTSKLYFVFLFFFLSIFKVTSLSIQNNSNSKDKDSKEDSGKKEDDEVEKPLSAAEQSLLQKILHKGLVETTQDLEIQRKDPSSPLYSVKSFEALHLYVSISMTHC